MSPNHAEHLRLGEQLTKARATVDPVGPSTIRTPAADVGGRQTNESKRRLT
jgi:hypothetical protein